MEQKTEIPGFYKANEGIIINKDNDGLAAYKKQKAAARKMSEIETELKSIKSDVTEIKQMLKELVK